MFFFGLKLLYEFDCPSLSHSLSNQCDLFLENKTYVVFLFANKHFMPSMSFSYIKQLLCVLFARLSVFLYVYLVACLSVFLFANYLASRTVCPCVYLTSCFVSYAYAISELVGIDFIL